MSVELLRDGDHFAVLVARKGERLGSPAADRPMDSLPASASSLEIMSEMRARTLAKGSSPAELPKHMTALMREAS